MALLVVALAALAHVTLAQINGGYDPTRVGRLQLPQVDVANLPDECFNFTEACLAEKSENYEAAFAIYESRYSTCGDAGWTIDGHNHGSNDVVTFKTTPCGTKVAVKGLRTPNECMRLRMVSTGESAVACPHCFPRYYYFGNGTRACYSERVNMIGWGRVMSTKRNLDPAGVQRVKSIFLQGVAAIHVLRNHGLEHNDLSFRNIALREVDELDGEKRLHIVIFDLGGSRTLDQRARYRRLVGEGADADVERALHHSGSDDGGSRTLRGRRLGGNGPFPDLYVLACDFMEQMYNGSAGCRKHLLDLPNDEPATSFRYAFHHIMEMNIDHQKVPDYHQIAALIHAVTHK